MVKRKALGADVAAIKIWLPNGTIAYSDRPEQIGRTYPLFDNLRRAFNGQVVAQFDDLGDDENEYERSLGLELLEIYAPVRESGTNRTLRLPNSMRSMRIFGRCCGACGCKPTPWSACWRWQ
jgi:hypothetical protein